MGGQHVRAKVTCMTHHDDVIRTRLHDERRRLLIQRDALVQENQRQPDGQGVRNHMADEATDVFSRERNLALIANSDDLLAQIDTAIQRLDRHSYGSCLRCGTAIEAARLEALPYAAYCLACQAIIEHEH